MMEASYYREQAARARRLAGEVRNHPEVAHQLHDMAQDYGEIADELEAGAITVRHPEFLSAKQRR